MMKVLQKLLLLTAITVGFSLTAMAQRQDPKKDPPPKDPNPPKIKVVPKENDKPKDKPKNNDNKKPGMAFLRNSDETEFV